MQRQSRPIGGGAEALTDGVGSENCLCIMGRLAGGVVHGSVVCCEDLDNDHRRAAVRAEEGRLGMRCPTHISLGFRVGHNL